MDLEGETVLRRHVMDRLAALAARNGGSVRRDEVAQLDLGDGTHRRLIDRSRGIWNPRDLGATLSIVSSPDGPYQDEEVEGGFLRYDYRAGSDAGDNTKLRAAMELALPIILFKKIHPGVYAPIFPVYVVQDDPLRRQFLIALDESVRFLGRPDHLSEDQRRYAERVVRQRLHQPVFRARVIHAYATRCAVCLLRHGELLDAAHIVADGDEGQGQAIVPNGLSLCKIHHAAFDRNLMGITPEYVVRINQQLLEEEDGPMLRHGLQEMHGRRLQLPAARQSWPDRDRLDQRWQAFMAMPA